MRRMALPREPGRELFDGRYRLESVVGTGGMATVWRAMDESLGRVVAIKMLAERYTEDESFVERFRREAQAAAGLNHPNIVSIYDRGEADGSYYIAMEYLDGRSSRTRSSRTGRCPRRGPSTTRCRSCRPCASPTATASCTATSSRTTSWAATRRLKVTDFGIARAGAAQMTEVGSIIGTAQYLSPEQARGQQVRPAVRPLLARRGAVRDADRGACRSTATRPCHRDEARLREPAAAARAEPVDPARARAGGAAGAGQGSRRSATSRPTRWLPTSSASAGAPRWPTRRRR